MSNEAKKKEVVAAGYDDNDDDATYGVSGIVRNATLNLVFAATAYAMGRWRVDALVAWTLLLFAAFTTALVDRGRRAGRARRRRHTRQAASQVPTSATSSELPSWALFPDVHGAEWFNQIIMQMWPSVSAYTQKTIKPTIEHVIVESLRQYKIIHFTFDKLILGSVPPKIWGIKVHSQISRDQIILDMDIVFASNCEISFYVSKIPCGLKDFQIRGTMRMVMKPLISTLPLIGKLEIFFLKQPEIDYDLTGVADVLDVPGLRDVMRKVIGQQIAAQMVLPNKLSIVLSNDIGPQLVELSEPEGVLRVHVIEAKNLVAKDMNLIGRKGKSDPFVTVTLGAQQYRTPTIHNELNPKWDYWCEFVSFSPKEQVLKLKIFDEDNVIFKRQSNLGRVVLQTNSVIENGEIDMWVDLEDIEHGMVHVGLQWLELTLDKNALKNALAETQGLRVTNKSSAVLSVYIDSAINLPAYVDPVVRVKVGQTTQETVRKVHTGQPVYEQEFIFLVPNPETDNIEFMIIDQKTNTKLGMYVYELTALLLADKMHVTSQPYDLIIDDNHQHLDSKLSFALQLKFLKKNPKSKYVIDDTMTKSLLRRFSMQSDRSNVSVNGIATVTEASENRASAVGASLPLDGHTSGGVPSIRRDSMKSRNSTSASDDPEPLIEQITIADLPPEEDNPSFDSGPLGSIHLTLLYCASRQRLYVTVHKVADLPIKDASNMPDPYVKLYLLPKNENGDTKRKTETYKDQCNPAYEETFEYIMNTGELNSKRLEATVLTKKTWHSPVLGRVVLNISDYINANETNYTGRFNLQTAIKY